MLESIYNELSKSVSISRETFERLTIYHDTLLKWQPKINLVGPDTVNDSWRRHFLDSLQLLSHLPNLKSSMVDMGSGAGFPGMVIAICGASDMTLIESDARKVTFLREIARLTDTKLTVFHGRIEDFSSKKFDVVLSRACSSLTQLISYSREIVSHETIYFFHKGKNYSMELKDAEKEWNFNTKIIPSVTDPEGVILNLSHIDRRRP